MAFRSPQEPKPYDFVPLPDRVERAKPAGHHRFTPELLSGNITGELTVLTPVHVASGNIELTRNDRIPLVKAFFRASGNITIPGSSLKGAVRSVVEAITRSCVRVHSRAARDLPHGFEPCEIRDKNSQLCPACRLFGAMGYQGQVRFADATLIQGKLGTMLAPSLFGPRSPSKIYYGPNRLVKGRKFYFHGQPAKGNVPLEVCDVESRFRLHGDFANLTEAELGVLLTALGRGTSSFALKLGGAKPVCCGSVEVQVQSVEMQDSARAAVEFEITPNFADPARSLKAAEFLLVRTNLERLYSILRRDNQRSCPSQSY